MAERRRRRAFRGGSAQRVLPVFVLSLALLAAGLALYRYCSTRGLPASDITVPDYVDIDYLPLNPYSRPGTPLREISAVVVHYVGNPGSTAENNRSYFRNLALTHETYASSHFLVGLEGEILQCVPLTEIAYCSNSANDYSVSIEVCHEDDTGEFSAQTMESLQTLVCWLCETFSLDPEEDVIRHYDVTGKICPKYYVENEEAWEAFRADVREQMDTDAANAAG